MNEDKLKKIQKLTNLKTDAGFVIFNEIEKVGNRIDSVKNELSSEISGVREELKKKLESELVLEIDRAELKGEPGYSPKKGEDYFDGNDYVLTEQDKLEIVSKIEVPVVEKIVEKVTEKVIVEKPIIHEITKEVAIVDSAEVIVKKINDLPIDDEEKQIDASHIKNLPKLISQNAKTIHRGGQRISIKDESTTLTDNVTSIAFTGAGVTATHGGSGLVNVAVTAPSGTVDGTGAANQIAYWTDANTIAGDNDFTWDPVTKLFIVKSNDAGIILDAPTGGYGPLDGISILGIIDPNMGGVANALGLNVSSVFAPTTNGTSYWAIITPVVVSGSATITEVVGNSQEINTRSGASSFSGTITNFKYFRALPKFQTGTITNIMYYSVEAPAATGATVANVYGLHLADITQGSTINRAIKTGLGNVEFGDDVIFTNDNTDDIGATGTKRPRNVYVANQLISEVVTGTAPLAVSSTTLVTNLNADRVDGASVGTSGAAIPLLNAANTWSANQTYSADIIPSGTRSLGSSIAAWSVVYVTTLNNGLKSITVTDIAGLSLANTFTANQTISGTAPTLTFTDTTASADDWSIGASTDNAFTIRNTTDGRDDLQFDGAGAAVFGGAVTCTTINTGNGAVELAAGVYTPTRSAEANMDANVTMTEAHYSRVGSTVTVSGRFTADPTLTATTTSFEMTLPVASNIGAAEDCAGVAFCGNVAGLGAEVTGSVANDTAVVTWKASDITSQTWSYHFSYQII